MRRRAFTLVTVVVLAGCAAPGSASPSPAASPSAVASPSPTPTTAPSTAPSPSPVTSPSTAPSGTPCPALDAARPIRSESLVDVRVESEATDGRVTFMFGPPDPAWPAGPPEAEFVPATPPFIQGASGLPLDVPGQRHVMAHFTSMKLSDDAGVPVYDGPDRLDPGGGVIRSVVLEEAFEGVVNWIIGYDGSGCVSVEPSADGLAISVVVAGP